ncbi:MAG: phosphatidate cytidylyltransferase [Leptonema sp. (in: bacteria)]
MQETLKRIISGFSIAGVVILLLNHIHFFYGIPILITILILSFFGLREYYILTDKKIQGKPIPFLGFFFGFLFILSYYLEYLYQSKEVFSFSGALIQFLEAYQKIKNPVIPILIFFVMITKSYSMMFRPIEGNTYNSMATVMGVLYVSLPLAIILPMLVLKQGSFIFVFSALGAIMTDVGGYFGGRWFGKHNAGLKVSPKKTWEGYISGIIFANIVNFIFLYFWIYFHPNLTNEDFTILPSYLECIVLTLVFSLVSIFGDLVESALKRDAKIKDSSSLIPGHGGFLDLADAMLFSFPLGYFYFYIKIQFLL